VSIEPQLIELHHRKFTLEAERVLMVDPTITRDQARDDVTAINHKGRWCPTFARASQNMTTAAALQDTLLASSTTSARKASMV
jgi:hypothetical protein